MSGPCSTHGEDEKCTQIFGWKASGEKTTWETDTDQRKILKWILEKKNDVNVRNGVEWHWIGSNVGLL